MKLKLTTTDDASTRNKSIAFFKREFKKSQSLIQKNHELRQCLATNSISNIVAAANLSITDVNLVRLAQENPICNYHKPTFAAEGIRLLKPWCTSLIYPIGMFVCMGTKSPSKALLACLKYVQVFNEQLGLNCEMTGFQIDNYVYNIYTFPLDLPQCLRDDWSEVIEYDIHKFPGATIRCELMGLPFHTDVVVTLFDLGKVNITGAKCYEEAMFMFIIAYYRYIRYIKKKNTGPSQIKRHKRVLDPKMHPVFKAELVFPRVVTNEEELRKLNINKRPVAKVYNDDDGTDNHDGKLNTKRHRVDTPPPLFEEIDKIDNIILQMAGKPSF